MTKEELFNIYIEKPDTDMRKQVKASLDDLSKPIDGFGDFEDIICRLGSIQGLVSPVIDKRAAVIVCADNGVIEEGTSQSTAELTRIIAGAVGAGISTINKLCEAVKTDVVAIDAGMMGSEPVPGVLNRKVAEGTANFLKGPAMTEAQVVEAIKTGISLVKELKEQGYQIISTGEVGAGNTTTSTAVLCKLLNLDFTQVTGRGSGLDDAGYRRKLDVIGRGLSNCDISECDGQQEIAFKVLSELGGLDHACLAGLFIGGAIYHIPVLIDGVTTAAAAVVADRLVPGTSEFMIPSHRGREGGCLTALNTLGLKPLIDGNMALGEGTGAVLLFPILDALLHELREGARFSDIDMEALERLE